MTGVTQDLLQLVVYCSATPEIWCRAQFNGDCFCISHNNNTSLHFPENTSFLQNSIALLINQSKFRGTFAGSFIACATKRNIHKVFRIAGMHVRQITEILSVSVYL